jgi:hypothetical protein
MATMAGMWLEWLLLICICCQSKAATIHEELTYRLYGSSDPTCAGESHGYFIHTYYRGGSCTQSTSTPDLASESGWINTSGILYCGDDGRINIKVFAYVGTGDECSGTPITTQALNDASSYAYGQCFQNGLHLQTGVYQQTDAFSDDVLQVMCDVGCTALCVNSTGTTTTTTVQPSATFTLLGGQTISYGQTFTFAGSPYASGGDYTFYGTATTLSGPISAGTTSFIVASQAGFQIGDTILIGGEGSNGEIKTIVSFSSININSGLSTSHGSGSTVVQVFSSSGSSGGDPVALFGDVRREFGYPQACFTLFFICLSCI